MALMPTGTAATKSGTVRDAGHTFSDPSYPYSDQEIGTSAYRGFDFGDIGLNGLLIPRVYPNEWHDVMSYSNNQWISDYTYVGIKNFSGLLAGPPEQAIGGDYLQLSGVLFPDDHEAAITQARRWVSLGFTPTPPTPGAYRIRLLDGGGELAHYDFTPIAGEDDSVLLISEFVPFAVGTTRLEITHPGSGDLAWSYDLSTNAPVVSNVHLVSPPSPVSGVVTLDWNASDADGDTLTYDVLYSDDNGTSWQVVQMGLADTIVQVDTTELAGSLQGRFKVIANDGLNQGEAMSAAYNVQMKAPTITVISPADGQTFVFDEEVYFAAEVYDLQDGDVGSIQWRDQTNFLLGTGTEFSQDDLIIGANDITVTAVNSAGLSTSVMFTIYVDDEWLPPDATLTVGPDQVSFWVADGTTALQTTAVAVNNLGAGEFTVTVSENAPWLSVSQSGGSTPTMLTLTADPDFVQPGQVLSTNLLVTGSLGGGSQTVTVPVSFGMGQITHPGGGGGTIYLPVILKP
ncbi:MAG: BACON domain-containing protein [Anaerolineae bacterium]|nr:BACON domain-containing protein [Anaerolineae bacterium]